jgi:hypothetical protein
VIASATLGALAVAAIALAGWCWSRASRAETQLSAAQAQLQRQVEDQTKAEATRRQAFEAAQIDLQRAQDNLSALTVRHQDAEARLTTLATQAQRVGAITVALAQAEAKILTLTNRAKDAEETVIEQSQLLQTTQGRLEQAERELSRLRVDREGGASRAIFVRMQELDQRAEELQRRLDVWARRAQDAEAELSRRESEAHDASLIVERDELRARVGALEDSQRRVATTRAALRALGLPVTPRDDQLFSPERREATESALREVYTGAQAAAAVICDRRGVSWARFGNPLIVERLVATAAQAARHPATEALGRPVQLVSELFGVYGRHLIHLPGPDLWLGVTGSRECPTLGLRLARLQLIGVPTLPTTPPHDAAELALDPDRSDRLGAWAARRGALAAAIFGDGDPASTDSPFAGDCAPLVPEVLTAFRRVQRDGFAAGFTLLWRGEDDLCLVARVIDEGQTVAFARFTAPPSPRALDDLSATVRWLSPPMAAAS